LTVELLRKQALAATLFAPTTLGRAIASLGFVQADPIRSPARAQDLILRHRVAGYRAGDLERRFARLTLEEDFLYAYGFMPRAVARLLHPRHDPGGSDGRFVPRGLAADVLALVREQGPTHPAELEMRFGRERAVNGWGGMSKATTRTLQSLHYHGLLRVVSRRDGIRIYDAAPAHPEALPAEERARRLVLLIARILSPVPAATLRAAVASLARRNPGLDVRATVHELIKSGALERGTVDGETYFWPAVSNQAAQSDGPPVVRFLAPFDPIVWDRRRFEHLWGWTYRFEAYTPVAKRRRGYYAMPLLWRDEVIGWANVGSAEGRLRIDAGFVSKRPQGSAFRLAFEAEVARMQNFLDGRRSRSR
jgi:uncharacterized protein